MFDITTNSVSNFGYHHFIVFENYHNDSQTIKKKKNVFKDNNSKWQRIQDTVLDFLFRIGMRLTELMAILDIYTTVQSILMHCVESPS